MQKLSYIYISIILVVFSSIAFSATYYVDHNQLNDKGSGTSWADAKKTVSGALSIAVLAGDQIFVHEGTYSEGNLQLASGISVYGGFAGSETMLSERDYIENQTVLDKSNSTAFSSFAGLMDGFDLTNYSSIASVFSAQGVMQNCRLFSNVSLFQFSGKLDHCLIYGNGPSAELHCLSGAVIDHCTIANNDMLLWIYSNAPFFNTIYSGSVTSLVYMGTPYLNYCLWPSMPSSYIGMHNVISSDASFVNPISDENADYRLTSSSPCLNKGSSVTGTKDYYGLSRPYSGSVDIGACEYNEAPSMAFTSTSPVPIPYNATEFKVHGTYTDAENDLKSIYISSSGYNVIINEEDSTWYVILPVVEIFPIFSMYATDSGYIQSPEIIGSFSVSKVLPVIDITSPSSNQVIPFSQSSLDVDVTASDDNEVSEILFRLGETGDWSSSFDISSGSCQFTVQNIPEGENVLYVKAKDADGNVGEADSLEIERLPERIYINKASSAPSPDGLSWETAYSHIYSALNDYSGLSMDFWVASGIYANGRVDIAVGDKFYGGFNGTETALDQRDLENNQTILDGKNSNSCAHVNGTLDGFSLTNGYRESGNAGAGAYVFETGILRNSRIYGNTISGEGYGAGVYVFSGTLEKCEVYNNSTGTNGMGGGIYSTRGTVSFCNIYDNEAWKGAGICNRQGQTNNCRIYGNSASSSSGGAYITGNSADTIYMRNCLIYDNDSTDQIGGIELSTATMTGCTVFGNDAGANYGGISYDGIVNSCILYGNTDSSGVSNVNCQSSDSFIYSCSSDFGAALTTEGSITLDPLFVNTSGAVDTWDFSLQDASPCINAGGYSEDLTGQLDIAEHDRLYGSAGDMGSYEMNLAPALVVSDPISFKNLSFISDYYTFQGTCSDPEGAIDGLDYRVNASSWTSLTVTETFSVEIPIPIGDVTVDLRSRDQEGPNTPSSCSDIQSFSFTRAANTAPELLIITPSQTVDFSHANLTVSGTVTDSDCGVRTLEYNVNNGGWNNVTVTGENWSADPPLILGDNVIEFRASDLGADYGDVDLTSTQAITVVRSQNVAPEGSITVPSQNETVLFNVTSFEFSGVASDSDGSVSEVMYRNNFGNWLSATGTESWSFSADLVVGPNYIEFMVVDNATDYGASENGETSLGQYSIQRNSNTYPDLSIANRPTDYGFPSTSFTLSCTASDSDCGIRSVDYRVNNGDWSSMVLNGDYWTAQVSLAVGDNLVEARATDCGADYGGSDISTTRSHAVNRADNIAPGGMFHSPSQNETVLFSAVTYDFKGEAWDEDGLVFSAEYRINGGSWATAVGTDLWSFSADLAVGPNEIEVRVNDNASEYGAAENASTILGGYTITRMPELVSNFIVDEASVEEDSQVHFTDTSTGALESWSWDFDNDGTVDSVDADPIWIYDDPGLYTVSLTVTDILSEVTETKVGMISVYPKDGLDYDSALILDTIPENMCLGESCFVELTVKNTGLQTWLDDQMIYLGAVGNSDPLAKSNYLRVDTYADVRYGEEVTFRIEMKPMQAGVYTSDWQMIYEGNFWFGVLITDEVTVEQRTAVKNNQWVFYR